MGAAWLKNYLAPVRFLVAGIAQARDDRVNFRNGFTASQVADADGANVLTIDADLSDTSYEPTADTIPLRNGSGTLKGNVITATTFTYVTPKEFTFREPIRPTEPAVFDPVTGWSINASLELEANAVPLQWVTELALVPGSTLTELEAVYTPPGAHVGLPGDQPSIELFEVGYGAAPVLVESIQDNAADLVAYETQRTLTLVLTTPLVVNANKRYVLQFNSETAANSLAGTVLHAPAIWTVELMAP